MYKNKSYQLGFISDENIYQHVKNTVEKYRFSIDLKKFNDNLIDPIKLTFDAKIYQKTILELIEAEVIRQIDKSNTNHIGYFHQNIFQYFSSGWSVPSSGYDVINNDKNIYAEIKNKHNTMNSSSAQKTYMRMQHTLLQNSNAECFLVEVIAKNSQDKPWDISLDGTKTVHNQIRRISMDKFYEIVTKDKLAFVKLCRILPGIIDDVINDIGNDFIQNTVFSELEKISPDIMKSIFILSFAKYEGFENFNFEVRQ